MKDMHNKPFEAAVNLRPDLPRALPRALLRTSTQVKARRFFLWFSDHHGHYGHQVLETNEINLERDKRMLIKGGAEDATYKIYVITSILDLFPSGLLAYRSFSLPI
jgi:hypothetical protein